MSAFLDQAEQLKTLLDAEPSLAGASVIVDRQKDVQSDFSRAMAKVGGAAILILFTGTRNGSKRPTTPDLTSTFEVAVWTKPVLRDGEPTGDELAESVIKSLHNAPSDEHCTRRLRFDSLRLLSNKSFLIYVAKFEASHLLS